MMKSIIILLISLLSIQTYASTCSDLLEDKIINIYDCRYGGFHDNNCPEIMNQYESLKALMLATWPLKLSHVLETEKTYIPLNLEISYSSSKNRRDLRGKEISDYLKLNHENIRGEVISKVNFEIFHTLPSKFRFGKNFLPKFFNYVDENYQDYYMRYIRILKREISWEEVEKIEKGLSMGQVLDSLSDLNQNKCGHLLKRYGLKMNWKDIARETLDNFFKNLLKK